MRSKLSLALLGGAAPAAIAYFTIPPTALSKLLLYNGLGLASVIAIFVGVRIHKPVDRRPWVLLGLGLASFLIGDICYYVLEATTAGVPFPSPADAFYLGMYPFVIAGIALLVRQTVKDRDWASLIDAGIMATAMFASLWILLIDSALTDDSMSGLGRVISLAYPVMDVLVLAVVARLAVSVHLRHPGVAMLSTGIAALLLADVCYGLLSSAGTYSTGSFVDAFWLLFYLLCGAAALHPSMATTARGASTVGGRITPGRLGVLCLATILVPLIDLFWGRPVDKVVTTLCSIALFLLVLSRAMGLMRIARTSDVLRHAATHDALTGLANRSLFSERVEEALRRDEPGPVTVVFVDLDDFKVINDSMGHQAGDELLVRVAERFTACVRDGDLVARLGGDEFALLLPSVTGYDEAIAIAERIADALLEPIEVHDRQVLVSASVGIVVEERSDTAEAVTLLRSADTAMYLAKEKGKGRFEFFDESLHSDAVERLELKADLQHALERGELDVYYQPIVDLADGRVEGVEALLRWDHAGRGFIPPDRFIPIAEATGMIVPIGRWVLQEACSQVRRWQDERPGEPPLGLSVNLSVRQLRDQRLVNDVHDALTTAGLEPGQLTLEITESMLIGETERGATVLGQLKALGIRLAIDDFGTGYSSLSYLRRFPVDCIKIDRSFVSELAGSPTSQALVRAVIDLARSLSMTTVAEGVEQRSQVATLSDLRCGLAQGFLYSKALAVPEFTAFLSDADEQVRARDRGGRRRRQGTGPANSMRVEARTGIDAVVEIAPEVTALHTDLALPLTSQLPWLLTWAEVHDDWTPLAVTVHGRRKRDLEAVALLATRPGAEGMEVVGLGHGLPAGSTPAARRAQSATRLARGITEALDGLGSAWSLALQQLPEDSMTVELLAQRLPGARLEPDIAVPQITLVPGLVAAEYLSEGMRRQLRKAHNRIAADGRKLEIAFLDGPDDIRALLGDLERVHLGRERSMGRLGEVDDVRARTLWRALIERLSAERQVEVGTLSIDGELAAYAVALLDGASYRIYDGHMDTGFARYSPGRLIEAAAMDRAASTETYRQVDWMTGVGAEKILSINSVRATLSLHASSQPATATPAAAGPDRTSRVPAARR